VEILHSAFRHDVQADGMQHVLTNSSVIEEVADNPIRYLALGPDRSGNLLELVVMD